MLAYVNRQPLFSGQGPSTMKSPCCNTSDSVAAVAENNFETDVFEGSQEEINTGDDANALPVGDDNFHANRAPEAAEEYDFSEWETFPLLEEFRRQPGVISEAEKENYKVVIQDGRFFRPDGRPFLQKSALLRYVVDADGQLFMEDRENKKDIASHASFIGNNPVRCSGRMVLKFTEDGKAHINSIDNQSGHYYPSNQAVLKLVAWLKQQGVGVDTVRDHKMEVIS